MQGCLDGKTIIITGATGMLGSAFHKVLGDWPGTHHVIAYSKHDLDITHRERVLSVAAEKPDFILHCAAMVNAERCEVEPDLCWAIQVEGFRNVVDLAVATGAKILYPQSFLIFDGGHLPIQEDTPPAPLSVYGRCKLEAEQLLLERLPNSLVVRMAGFFGGWEADKNFVGAFTKHLIKLLHDGTTSFDVGDRVWQPTYTIDLASNCLTLLEHGKTGIYSMSTHGEATFHELATACVEELGVAHRIAINRVSETTVARSERARRPHRAIMVNTRLHNEGMDHQRPWRQALKDYLQHPYFMKAFSRFHHKE